MVQENVRIPPAVKSAYRAHPKKRLSAVFRDQIHFTFFSGHQQAIITLHRLTRPLPTPVPSTSHPTPSQSASDHSICPSLRFRLFSILLIFDWLKPTISPSFSCDHPFCLRYFRILSPINCITVLSHSPLFPCWAVGLTSGSILLLNRPGSL